MTLDPHEHVAFAEPSLVVHAFAPLTAGSNDRNAAQSYLRSLWEACGRLGMSDAPLPGVDTVVRLARQALGTLRDPRRPRHAGGRQGPAGLDVPPS